ncbi:MAG: hypothetical protein ACLU0O_11300 [Collinsella sp.]
MEPEAAARALRKMEPCDPTAAARGSHGPAGVIALQVHDLLLRDFTYTYQGTASARCRTRRTAPTIAILPTPR